MKVQPVHPALLDTHTQLHETIPHCSDKGPTVINRQRLPCGTPDEGQVTGDKCQLLSLLKALLKDQYYFMLH
jgi:hypothetical protein